MTNHRTRTISIDRLTRRESQKMLQQRIRRLCLAAGLLFNSYLDMTAGQTFTISGTMTNAGITLLDPDNQPVFPYFNNYFSGSESPVSLSGTLAKSGIID